MTTALVVGAGVVGSNAARHLAASAAVDEVILADPVPGRAALTAGASGGGVTALEATGEEAVSRGGDVVAVASGHGLDVARRCVDRGMSLATADDDPDVVRCLLDLDDAARVTGSRVLVGAALSPGLSEILTAYAAEVVDEVDEVHVARFGTGGPECVRRRRSAARGAVHEFRGGAWVSERAFSGRRLVSFPDPVGAHECRRARSAVPFLVASSLPAVRHVTFRDAVTRRDLLPGARSPRSRAAGRGDPPLGGLHVEVRGRRGAAQEVLVYGSVDHVGAVCGAVLAVAALAAAGALDGVPGLEPGATGLGALAPVPALAALAALGVRAAEFVGNGA